MKNAILVALTLLAISLPAMAGPKKDVPVASGDVFLHKSKDGDEHVWIRLNPGQDRVIQLKHRIQRKKSRWQQNYEKVAAPIYLSDAQRIEIARLIGAKRPLPKTLLFVEVGDLRKARGSDGRYIVRSVTQLSGKSPSDIPAKR